MREFTDADVDHLNTNIATLLNTEDEATHAHILLATREGYGENGLYGIACALARSAGVAGFPTDTSEFSETDLQVLRFAIAVTYGRRAEAADVFIDAIDDGDATTMQFMGGLIGCAQGGDDPGAMSLPDQDTPQS